MNRIIAFLIVISLVPVTSIDAKRVKLDYSIVDVPEEGGVKFERITENSDCVNSENLVSKRKACLESRIYLKSTGGSIPA